jgi:hypothetical protein
VEIKEWRSWFRQTDRRTGQNEREGFDEEEEEYDGSERRRKKREKRKKEKKK